MKSILDCKQRLHFTGSNAYVSMYVDTNTDYILPDFYKREIIVDQDVRCTYKHNQGIVSLNVTSPEQKAYVTIPLKANVDTHTKHTSKGLLHFFLISKEFYLEGTPLTLHVSYRETSNNTVGFRVMKQLTLQVGCRNSITVYTEIIKAKPAFIVKSGVEKRRSNMVAFPTNSCLSSHLRGRKVGNHLLVKSSITYEFERIGDVREGKLVDILVI